MLPLLADPLFCPLLVSKPCLFEYFSKVILYSESPDHVLLNDI